MKSILICAATAAAFAAASPAAAQKPRFPIRREPLTAPVPLPPTVAPTVQVAEIASASEQAPVAAPAGTIESTSLPEIVTTTPEPAVAPATGFVETAAAPAPATTPPAPIEAPPERTQASAEARGGVYTMQSGDTLSGVSRRFKTTVTRLRELNDLTPEASIRAGQKIRLPAAAVDTGTEPFAKGPAPTDAPALAVAPPVRPKVMKADSAPSPVLVKPAPVARTPDTEPVRVAAATPAPLPATPPPARVVADPAPAPIRAPVSSAPRIATAAPATAPPVPAPVVAPVVSRPAPLARAPALVTAPASSSIPTTAAAALDPTVAGRGRFVWPVKGEVLSGFGPKGPGQRNDGLNIAAAEGDGVRAAATGEVVYAGDQVPGFGKLVLLKHDGGWVTAYAHLADIAVKMKDQINQGSEIGKAGRTGAVTAPQLHFEVRYAPTARDKARPVDPMALLP